MINSQTDIELMSSVRDGDVRNLGPLYQRYRNKLYNYFLKMSKSAQLSEDMVQEVFERIIKYKHTFRGSGSFEVWMFFIARNIFYDQMKKRKNVQPVDDFPFELTIHSDEIAADDQLIKNEDLKYLKEAFLKLDDRKREVIVLCKFQEMNYEDVAELLGCSYSALKVRVFRAVKELTEHFHALQNEQSYG